MYKCIGLYYLRARRLIKLHANALNQFSVDVESSRIIRFMVPILSTFPQNRIDINLPFLHFLKSSFCYSSL